MHKVAVVGKVAAKALECLTARSDVELRHVDDGPPESIASTVAGADAVLLRTSKLTAAHIASAPKLKVVSRHGVGYDNVDLAAMNARRIPLAVSATANMMSVAEHAFFMMLELAKAGRAHDAGVKAGNWAIRKETRAIDLHGRTLLIVGLGRIGRQVARRARAFGMPVVAIDPFVANTVFAELGCERGTNLDEALAAADIVTLHLPLSADTRNMIDAARLARLRGGAILINTARGGLVDEPALADALRAGRLRGAGIDVLEAEPPPDDHPLFGLDNVLLSPHTAGVTAESMLRMGSEAAANIAAVLDGKLDPSVIVNYTAVVREQRP